MWEGWLLMTLSANGNIFMHLHCNAHACKCFPLCCHLKEKALWKKPNLLLCQENIQSTQPYPNTCPFHITKVRDSPEWWKYNTQVANIHFKLQRWNLWSKRINIAINGIWWLILKTPKRSANNRKSKQSKFNKTCSTIIKQKKKEREQQQQQQEREKEEEKQQQDNRSQFVEHMTYNIVEKYYIVPHSNDLDSRKSLILRA